MKKKITLILIIISMNCLNIFAQILPNTTWTVYDNSNTIFAYFQFGNNKVLRSFDNITYTQTSKYWESGSNFTIFDIPPTSCASDTGKYTFTMQHDTLNFTLISDQCSTGRSSVIANYNWVHLLNSGISLLNPTMNTSIYPNPFTNSTTVSFGNEHKNTTIKVTDILGKEIKSQTFSGKQLVLEKGEMLSGVYFVQIIDNNNNILNKKIIIQ